MDGFGFLWKEKEQPKKEGVVVCGGDLPRDEKDAAFKQIIDEDYKALYNVWFNKRRRR